MVAWVCAQDVLHHGVQEYRFCCARVVCLGPNAVLRHYILDPVQVLGDVLVDTAAATAESATRAGVALQVPAVIRRALARQRSATVTLKTFAHFFY